MKTLVTYSSQTNNTRKLAEAVFQSLGGDKVILPMAEAGSLAPYDLIAVGFWLKAGQPDPATQAFLATVQGKRLFFFATHGAAPGSPHAQKAMAKALELARGSEVVGTFSCQGEVAPAFLEIAAAKNPQPPWLADAPAAKGHPDQQDIDALKGMIARLGL